MDCIRGIRTERTSFKDIRRRERSPRESQRITKRTALGQECLEPTKAKILTQMRLITTATYRSINIQSLEQIQICTLSNSTEIALLIRARNLSRLRRQVNL